MADENSYTKSKSAHGKIYEIIKASKKDFSGVVGQGKKMEFGKQGGFVTKDAKLAKELSDKFGYAEGGSRDLIVIERDDYSALGKKNLYVVPDMSRVRRRGEKK